MLSKHPPGPAIHLRRQASHINFSRETFIQVKKNQKHVTKCHGREPKRYMCTREQQYNRDRNSLVQANPIFAQGDMVGDDCPPLSATEKTSDSRMSNATCNKLLLQAVGQFCVIQVHLHTLTNNERGISITIWIDPATRAVQVLTDVVPQHQPFQGKPSKRQKSPTAINNSATKLYEVFNQLEPNHLLTWRGSEQLQFQRTDGVPYKTRLSQLYMTA